MNRRDFKKLANIRLKEAKCLLDNRKYSGAYYLCGYVVEFALKACFTKQIRRHHFPDKMVIDRVHTHDLMILLDSAELKSQKEGDVRSDKQLAVYWKVVSDWKEISRYEMHKHKEAKDFI